jgi:hypothetical protein
MRTFGAVWLLVFYCTEIRLRLPRMSIPYNVLKLWSEVGGCSYYFRRTKLHQTLNAIWDTASPNLDRIVSAFWNYEAVLGQMHLSGDKRVHRSWIRVSALARNWIITHPVVTVLAKLSTVIISIITRTRNNSILTMRLYWTSIFAVRFQVLTAASMKMTVFLDVAPCRLVEVCRRFRGACCTS